MAHYSVSKIEDAKVLDILAIVKIHKTCVSKVNSKFYSPAVIAEWLKDISQENVFNQFKKSSWVVTKTKEGQVVGFGQYSLKTAEIFQVNVLPLYQGQGFGTALYQRMLDDFKRKGVEEISLNSTLNAVGFYQKLGFASLGKTEYRLGLQKMEMVKMKAAI